MPATDLNAIRHVIWDWNGTLLDDAEACVRAVSTMMEKRNLSPLTLGEYQARIAFPVINLYYESGFDIEKEDYESICNEYIDNYIRNIPLIKIQKDAPQVLTAFSQKVQGQHIVSASGYDILVDQVEKYGLKPFFTHILGQSNNQAESKAHLATKLKELISCEPKEVLFIGDTVHDFEVASEAGFDCRLVTNGHCNRERLEKTGAPVYPNLLALYEAV